MKRQFSLRFFFPLRIIFPRGHLRKGDGIWIQKQKILKKYKAYKQNLTEEEVQYGIRYVVLFPPGKMSHKEVIAKITQLADEISLEDTVRAFLHSLSTGKNQYRTALASLLYAKVLPEHEPVLYGKYEWNQRCAYCGLKMSGEQMEVEIKNSVL